MKKLSVVFSILVLGATMTYGQVIGNFSPGLPPTVGFHPLYGYPVYNVGVLDDNSNVVYAPIGMPDLSATAPTNDTSGLTDYFINPALSTSWQKNGGFAATVTTTNKNGCLVITSTGVDSATSSLLVKQIPYATNSWSATLVIVGGGLPSMVNTGTVSTIGLGCGQAAAYHFIDYATQKPNTNVLVDNGLLLNLPALWVSAAADDTTARTNSSIAAGGSVLVPFVQPQVALGLDYVQSTKVLTYKAGTIVAGQPITLKNIATTVLPADPTNVVISVYEYDSVGAEKTAVKRVIKAFQFQQPAK